MSSKDAAVAEPEAPVIEPEKKQKTKAKAKPRKMPLYNVLLWNDDDHSYDYVVGMMQKLFGFPKEKGFKIAKEVEHVSGAF